jgi:hypothetical protein
MKPEILMPGGRQLYREQPNRTDGKIHLTPVNTSAPPGVCIAAPGAPSAGRAATGYACGSSNSAALATRGAIEILDRLLNLRSEPGGEALRDEHHAVLLKALLVHGANWKGGSEVLDAALRNGMNEQKVKSWIARFLGYGVADLRRVLDCTNQRATLVGCESIRSEKGSL